MTPGVGTKLSVIQKHNGRKHGKFYSFVRSFATVGTLNAEQTLLKLPNGAKYIALWKKHDEGTTAEALLVRELDRLEMSLQASVYQQQQSFLDLTKFFSSTRSVLVSSILKDVLQELEKLHNKADDTAQK